MELNAEQIKKALEWLDSLVGNSNDSDIAMFTYQLLGILYDTCEELTEENERLRAELAERPPKLIITKLPKKDQIAKEMVEDKPCT